MLTVTLVTSLTSVINKIIIRSGHLDKISTISAVASALHLLVQATERLLQHHAALHTPICDCSGVGHHTAAGQVVDLAFTEHAAAAGLQASSVCLLPGDGSRGHVQLALHT